MRTWRAISAPRPWLAQADVWASGHGAWRRGPPRGADIANGRSRRRVGPGPALEPESCRRHDPRFDRGARHTVADSDGLRPRHGLEIGQRIAQRVLDRR